MDLPSSESNFQDRIAQVAAEMGGADVLADKSQLSRASIYNYLNGESEPNLSKLVRLSHACGKSVEWLVTGSEPAQLETISTKSMDFIFLPRYEVRAAGGAGAVIHSEQIVDYLAFKSDWFHQVIGTPTDKMALISAVGDSMEPTIHDGDLLLIDTSATRLLSDAIYALAFRDVLQVKRLQLRRDGSVRIVSDNAKYDAELLSAGEAESLRIVGRVRWRGTRI